MSRTPPRAVVRYGFADTDATARVLSTAGWVDGDGVATVGQEHLLVALARTGDPDLALRTLDRLFAALGQGRSALVSAIDSDAGLRARLFAIVGGSTVLGDHLVAQPESWTMLRDQPDCGAHTNRIQTRRLLANAVGLGVPAGTGVDPGPDRPRLTGAAAVTALRKAYRDRLLVIAAADLASTVDPSQAPVPLASVSRSLTDLADGTLQVALALARADLPADAPECRLSVVAMGKTGARELNYLSDVDVIFVADHPDSLASDTGVDGAPDETAMLKTATTLAAQLMRICGQVAWEVDANLRPEGAAGALVRTPDSMMAYYQRWAQTWEFQALLKARPAAGDPAVGRRFLELVRPLVWAASRRESFVQDVQAMRRRVEDNIPAGHRGRELKLGAGGLRDVEFAVQLLQLVHGRTDPQLRATGTLTALRHLVAGGYVGRRDGAEMAAAYTFLRRAEHRLQLQRLRRTHLLPDSDDDLRWLARTQGAGDGTMETATESFTAERLRHATNVRRLHEKLFYRPLLNAVVTVGDDLVLTTQAASERLAALGFSPPLALRHLTTLTAGVSRRAAIQRTLLPVLLDVFSRCPDPDAGLLAYVKVSEALAQTPWYLRLLRDEGTVAIRLAELLGVSRLVPDLLARAPEVLRLLDSDTGLAAVDPQVTARALLARSARAKSATDAADSARSARRHELLRLACGEVLGQLDSEQICAGLTCVAQATVIAALAAATEQVQAQRGPIAGRLAVIGMGRLGGAELGYSSDADVIYVAEPDTDADTEHVLAGFAAVVELMTSLLGRPSADPPLLVDADLRPEGRNGRMVRTLGSYQSYWERFAEPWERQALLRARPVAGDAELGAAFIAAANEFRYPAGGLVAKDVREIRRIKARVDAERLPRGADPGTHTKLGHGGLADIEWTIQLIQLRQAAAFPALQTPGTLPAIAAAEHAGVLSSADATVLRDGWLSATKTRNAIMLVLGKPDDQIPRHGRALRAVAEVLGYRRGSDPGEFVDDYRRTARRARKVVDRLFAD